jgi:nitroreductase / dihydropteridine reductase
MDDYKNMMWARYESLSQEWHAHHSAKQTYFSLGIALLAAAEQKVDATPMEGFSSTELDGLLGLPEKGLRSAVILALGYRDEANDYLVKLKKVKTPREEFITKIS